MQLDGDSCTVALDIACVQQGQLLLLHSQMLYTTTTRPVCMVYNQVAICCADAIVLAGMPPGRCFKASDCNATSEECDLSAASLSPVCRCNRGVDACQAVGKCKLKPPPPPKLTDCQRCSMCVNSVQGTVTLLAAAATTNTVKGITDALYSWCSANYTLTSCQQLQADVAASYKGNMGLRAGAVCVRLGQCEKSLVGNAAACLVTPSENNTGPLDVCSVNGVVGGGKVAGTYGGAAGEDANECHQHGLPRAYCATCLNQAVGEP